MSPSSLPEIPFVESVLHATDLSTASEKAFAHALAIALTCQAQLKILHVGSKKQLTKMSWTSFPAVRNTLQRWGLLEEGSPQSAVFDKLAVQVEKVVMTGRNATAAMLHHLEEHPTDLLVLGTEGREGLPRWFQPSVAERLARRSKTMTLFVPKKARGFVARKDGSISMRRILLPIDHDPSPQPAIQFATQAAGILGNGTVEITLLHVGDSPNMPDVGLPQDPGCSWNKKHLQGDVVKAIIGVASGISADLIAMVTAGHEGVVDALRGNVTERVSRQARCPVLAVPTDRVAEMTRTRKKR